MDSGIYAITNMCNGKQYIGSAVHLNRRRRQHFSALGKGKHDNSHLQRAFDRYGADTFDFRILEAVPTKEQLVSREQYWIDVARSEDGVLYNQRLVAASNLGLKHPHTEEAKRKISENSARHKPSPEHTEKLRRINTGRKHSDESRHKMSLSRRGKRRKTHCKRGHERNTENLTKWNACRICVHDWWTNK
jgi:group I intron endonuclease